MSTALWRRRKLGVRAGGVNADRWGCLEGEGVAVVVGPTTGRRRRRSGGAGAARGSSGLQERWQGVAWWSSADGGGQRQQQRRLLASSGSEEGGGLGTASGVTGEDEGREAVDLVGAGWCRGPAEGGGWRRGWPRKGCRRSEMVKGAAAFNGWWLDTGRWLANRGRRAGAIVAAQAGARRRRGESGAGQRGGGGGDGVRWALALGRCRSLERRGEAVVERGWWRSSRRQGLEQRRAAVNSGGERERERAGVR